ncbi:MAG: hypothetical protein JEZ12_26820 [Desulfobacterium sp.]|nr:hypothetical protein [Desulfobacterium sp.]
MKLLKQIVSMAVAILTVGLMASASQASPFATELVDHSASLDGSGWYNDPNDLLDEAATRRKKQK